MSNHGAMNAMEIKGRHEAGFFVIEVRSGRIDAVGAQSFKDRLRDLAGETTGDVVLDLKAVQFIDSSGLGAIVATMKALAPTRRLHLACLSPTVDKVFRLTRMDTVISIHADLAAVLTRRAG